MTLPWVSRATFLVGFWTKPIKTPQVEPSVLASAHLGSFVTADYHRLYQYHWALSGSSLLLDMYFFPLLVFHLVFCS